MYIYIDPFLQQKYGFQVLQAFSMVILCKSLNPSFMLLTKSTFSLQPSKCSFPDMIHRRHHIGVILGKSTKVKMLNKKLRSAPEHRVQEYIRIDFRGGKIGEAKYK